MKSARYCLEFVSLGVLLRLGEHLRQGKQSKIIANNIFWLKFLVESHLAMKNAISLIYRLKSIVQTHMLLKIKQKSLNQAQA